MKIWDSQIFMLDCPQVTLRSFRKLCKITKVKIFKMILDFDFKQTVQDKDRSDGGTCTGSYF